MGGRLNANFAELRNPNAFSPHGDLAIRFQDARGRFIVGVILGGLFWGLVIVVTILDATSMLSGSR